ncbi:phage tail protein [Acinetobacter sp. Ac_5812]|uniref:phage tail-collar fiber domain-containing protein n=1 Tax=Acinetobacter sp. Ac_5812 TaxID=1848937 RepID=UPI00148FE4A6|nr:phage tail protein [Acinetobacter sp. Ac_5812]NNP70397.1 hypothetical protein [Acinetobacter sp. Ac_5812]
MVIQYYLTDAGKGVALNAASLGLNVSLSHIAIGTAKYEPLTALGNSSLVAEVGRYPLNGGGVEPNSHTLRFVSSIEPIITADGFEIGIYTDAGVLFAIAATTTNTPLIRLVENIVTISTFGMILSTINLANLIVTIDPNTPICIALMNQHLDHPNPHPQYALNVDVNAFNKYSLLEKHILDLTALDSNTYYPVTIDLRSRQDCKFYIDTPLYTYTCPWSTHHSNTFNIYAEWSDYRLAWGENLGLRNIDKFQFVWSEKSPIIKIDQIYFNSHEYFYARGGTKYILYTEKGLSPVLHTSSQHFEAIGSVNDLHTFDLNLINVNDVNPTMFPEPTLLKKREHLDAYDPHPQYARQTDLENEQLWRTQADADLLQRIGWESDARITNDNQLQGNIDQERGWRESADSNLQQQQNTERDSRIYSDNLLNDKIDQANTARVNADNALSDRVTILENAPPLQVIGVGQSIVDVKSNRAANTTYWNTTGRAIEVSIVVRAYHDGGNQPVNLYVNTIFRAGAQCDVGPGGWVVSTLSSVVPDGSNYRINSGEVVAWTELR